MTPLDCAFREILRDRALEILAQAPALAGIKMEAERAVAVPQEDFPFLRAFARTERSELLSTAGTAPEFRNTATLHFLFENAAVTAKECARTADGVLETIRRALISAPAFYRNPVTGVIDVREIVGHQALVNITAAAALHVGEARLNLDVAFNEIFEPDVQAIFDRMVSTIPPEPGALPVVATTSLPQS